MTGIRVFLLLLSLLTVTQSQSVQSSPLMITGNEVSLSSASSRVGRRLLQTASCVLTNGVCACPLVRSCGIFGTSACSLAGNPNNVATELNKAIDLVWNGEDRILSAWSSGGDSTSNIWFRITADSNPFIVGGVFKTMRDLPGNSINWNIFVGNDTTFPGSNVLCYQSTSSQSSAWVAYPFNCNITGKYMYVSQNPKIGEFMIGDISFMGASGQVYSGGTCQSCASGSFFFGFRCYEDLLQKCGSGSSRCVSTYYSGFGVSTAYSGTTVNVGSLNDGNDNTEFLTNGGAVTYQFDMEKEKTVDLISVLWATNTANTDTTVRSRCTNVEVHIGTSSMTKCKTFFNPTNEVTIGKYSGFFDCSGLTGRYIWIYNPAVNGWTHLSEVKVSAKTCEENERSVDGACYCYEGYYKTTGLCTLGCPKGYYCNNSQIFSCPQGTYQPLLNQTSASACLPCANFSVNVPDHSSCICDSGHYNESSSQQSGVSGNTQFSPIDLTSLGFICSACTPGTYKPNASQSSCFPCPLDNYCVAASTLPTACPPNTQSPQGSSVITNCTPKPGYYGSAGVVPTGCPVNTYCTAGATQPTTCPQGTNSAANAPAESSCVFTHNVNVDNLNIIHRPGMWPTGAGWIDWMPDANFSRLLESDLSPNTNVGEIPYSWYADCSGDSPWVGYDLLTEREITWVRIVPQYTAASYCTVQIQISKQGLWTTHNGDTVDVFSCGFGLIDNRFPNYCPGWGSLGLTVPVANVRGRYVRWLMGRSSWGSNTGFKNMFVGAIYKCVSQSGQYCLNSTALAQNCPLNTLSPPGSTSLANCTAKAGFYGNAGLDPTVCPANSYCIAGSKSPVTCPLYTQSPIGSPSLQNCVAIAGYYGLPGVQASQCTQGFFTNSTGNTVCLTCAPGTITNNETGFINCIKACAPSGPGTYCPQLIGDPFTCPVGHYCDGVSLDKVQCPFGTYNTNTGRTSLSDCLNCPLFTVSSLNRIECAVCPAGTKYVPQNSSGPNYQGICQTCPIGSTSTANSTECGVCFPGSYTAGPSECRACRPGFYSDVNGLTACIPCPDGKYTYTTNGSDVYNVTWGAKLLSQCIDVPAPGTKLVCMPGTYRDGPSTCRACPRGYYCPKMSSLESDTGTVRKCPLGTYSSMLSGAIAESDCTLPSLIHTLLTFNVCGLSVNDSPALTGKQVTAMVPSLGSTVVYFTTPTAVYRLYLVQSTTQNTVDLIAGSDTISGNVNDVGTLARFSDLTAIGVDMDVSAASFAVVGDGRSIKLVDLYSRRVVLLGSEPKVGVVERAGGIAIRRNSNGVREAFVSDMVMNRIMVFDLDNYESYPLAGDFMSGLKGSTNGVYGDARFWEPKGLAFLEKNMNTSNLLLVADSKNGLIRVVNVDQKKVDTWFKPLDKISPEIAIPVTGISVSPPLSTTNKPLVYVSDATGKVKVIQFPTGSFDFKVVTEILVDQASASSISNVSMAFATGQPTILANNKVSFNQLVYLDKVANTLRTLVESATSNTPVARGSGTGSGQCHLPCPNSLCSALNITQKCGNSFLEPNSTEECDNSVKNGGGCSDQCMIRSGFTCPVGQIRCADPCVGYNYTYESKLYCEFDCVLKQARPGYTINQYCVENDIDECILGLHNCSSSNALCDNIPGSFRCLCTQGYFGDGYTCNPTSYAAYAVVDVPLQPSSNFILGTDPALLQAKMLLHSKIKRAYAETLYNSLTPTMKSSSSFSLNVLELAIAHSAISIDPNTVSKTKIEVSSRFETFVLAQAAAASVDTTVLSLAISKAIFGDSATTGAFVAQTPKTRTSLASSFTSVQVIDGWGMNITSVSYNRSCRISSGIASEQPRGGCWQVEMIYMGGPAMPKSDDISSQQKSSKNVLYLPRIDRNPSTLEQLSVAQSFTMMSGSMFPCDTMGTSAAGIGVTSKSTACCLRNFNTSYRPNARFKTFLSSALYSNAVPADYCASAETFNDTYPNSDVVFLDPENSEDGSTNDLVVGKIDGMPHSEVTLLETIDYTTRTFRVMLTLEEDDLKASGSIIQGNVGSEYSLIFFVGLANFKGLGGSIMATKNSQVRINVTKNNVLTISTFGANQDPLVSNVDMSLTRIKVTDFFAPVRYLYYLRPLFTIPSNFGSPDDSAGIVPISSIRVIKIRGTAVTTDINWKQACANDGGDFFWNSTSLKNLVTAAQKQPCVNTNLQICMPPINARQIVEFGIALPEDFLTEADFQESNPYNLQVQFMINSKDSVSLTNVRSMLSMAVELTPYGYTRICDTQQASQSLADVLQGNVYIGVASDSNEWNNLMLKKTNIDVPGTTPSNGFEFSTTTVQGAVMTFAALGDSKFFDDSRNLDQYVNIHDIHTVHFLEPIGGKGGPSPKFDAAIAKFHAGKAFLQKTDSVKRTVWLEPSLELLTLCPRVPSPTSKTCLTRTDSTFKNSVLTRLNTTVAEVFINNASSIENMQDMMSALMFQGGSNAYTRKMGTDFHNQLVTQLNLNNRYRRAYSVSPLINWGMDAIKEQFPTATSYTVCTKIIAIGMVTIASSTGVPLGRRLLSTHIINHNYNFFDEFAKIHGASVFTNNVNNAIVAKTVRKSRHLLQEQNLEVSGLSTDVAPAGGEDLSPTKTQSSNSFLLKLDVPGFDGISQMCTLYTGVPYERCNALKLEAKISGDRALNTCNQYKQQTPEKFALNMENNFVNAFTDDKSNVKTLNILDLSLNGCADIFAYVDQQQNATGSGGRRLLASSDVSVPENRFIIFSSYLIVGAHNTSAITIHLAKLQLVSTFFQSPVWAQFIAGGGHINVITIEETNSNGSTYVNITVDVSTNNTKDNVTNSISIIKIPNIPNFEDMFVTDYYDSKNARRSAAGQLKFSMLEMVFITVLNLCICIGMLEITSLA